MKLKLTQTQLVALHRFFMDHVISEKPGTIIDRLILLHMLKIYKKLRTKAEEPFTGKGFSINLSQEEALAYYEYFFNRSLGEQYRYEHNFIQSHIAQIDRAYA